MRLASCVLGPAIAAISLGLVGPLAIGERLGRNARFASLGNGSAAALMGACGYYISNRSVFLVTFLLAIPTLVALSRIREREIDIVQAHGAILREKPDEKATSILSLIRQKPLLIFAASILLLQLANAAMLPIMAGVVTTRSSQWAPVLIAACIIVPQAIVALMSPTVGRKAQAWGRRPMLLIGFGALAIRGILFATVTDPFLLVAVQIFDGITAAVFAVMIPLIVADVAFGSGHFNLALGNCRHRDRDRRLAQHGAGGLCHRQVRRQRRVPRACGRGGGGPAADPAGHAGDTAGDGVTLTRRSCGRAHRSTPRKGPSCRTSPSRSCASCRDGPWR